ncbi:hypothetical protein ABW21_db0200643 [Orbilia brochopaga]|nr:hypothetical protein ABW21_db0200643 [Drechslerella brochopaga]
MAPKKAAVAEPSEARRSTRAKTKPTRLIEQAPEPIKAPKPTKSILKPEPPKPTKGDAKRGRPTKSQAKKGKKVTIQEPEEEDEQDDDAEQAGDGDDEDELEEEKEDEDEDDDEEVEQEEPEPVSTKKQNIGKKRAPPAKQAGPAAKKQKLTQPKSSSKAPQAKSKPAKATSSTSSATKESGGGAKGKKKAAIATSATPKEPARSSSVPLLPDYLPDNIDKAQGDGVTYNSAPSNNIPNISIPVGSRFRIDLNVVGLAEDGACKHLFLLNGHRFEQNRLNNGGTKESIASSSKSGKSTTTGANESMKEATGGAEPESVGGSVDAADAMEAGASGKQDKEAEDLDNYIIAISESPEDPEPSDNSPKKRQSEEPSLAAKDSNGGEEAEK